MGHTEVDFLTELQLFLSREVTHEVSGVDETQNSQGWLSHWVVPGGIQGNEVMEKTCAGMEKTRVGM